MKQVDAHALQTSLRNLSDSLDRFFKKQDKAPRYKSKKNPIQSYKINIEKKNQLPVVSIAGNRVKLPKLGWIRCAAGHKVKGRILSATVRRTPSGKYFVSLVVNTFNKTGSAVGIDVGLAKFAVVSDGKVYENPKFFRKIEKNLQKEQRILARRKPFD